MAPAAIYDPKTPDAVLAVKTSSPLTSVNDVAGKAIAVTSLGDISQIAVQAWFAKNGVEGVFSAVPAVDPSAEFIPDITHMEAIERRLRVMDATALALCMDNGMPLNVFNMDDETNISKIISGQRAGTLVAT